ncbi:MAG TPA: aminoglycoside phosphotransferase family protein [Candidatus Limnocylindria bacterium]|nr:aminoglycoside phosphotransferase family protein [Candidatus Limnocylindria bacterium]
MLGALTVPPAEDEVARAAARISEGALGDATVARWPRAHDHHAYLLTARDGREYLFKAARMRHPGRMRRYVHVAAMLKEHEVPHPALRWFDMDKGTLEVPYLIQDYLQGQDGGSVAAELSFTDQHRVGTKLGAAFRALHQIDYVDTPTSWATEFDDRFRTRVAECVVLDALDKASVERIVAYYEARRDALDDVPRRLSHDDPSPENIIIERRADGWQFVALVDFERARGRDPLIDLAKLRATTFSTWPAMAAPFNAAYGALEPYGPDLRARAELYDLYVPIAAVAYFRENARPDREEAARAALRAWLEREG